MGPAPEAASREILGKNGVLEKMVVASWYGPGVGNFMANCHLFNPSNPTIVAHKSLPHGTVLEFTNKKGEKHRGIVQDRGPFTPGRHVDLSQAAAERLGFIDEGVTTLRAKIIGKIDLERAIC